MEPYKNWEYLDVGHPVGRAKHFLFEAARQFWTIELFSRIGFSCWCLRRALGHSLFHLKVLIGLRLHLVWQRVCGLAQRKESSSIVTPFSKWIKQFNLTP